MQIEFCEVKNTYMCDIDVVVFSESIQQWVYGHFDEVQRLTMDTATPECKKLININNGILVVQIKCLNRWETMIKAWK